MFAAKGKTPKPPPTERSQIWVEKYRPKTLDQVSSQDHTVNVLKATLLHTNMSHMLFYGPPGTGKTSTILALAKDLYGPDMIRSRVLELNASDERGIAIVREKVKNFAKTTVTNDTTNGAFPCPPYKIIILDEADSMTQDAQSALRRTMETYSKITRFCLICNYVTRIIEPLASRCSKFRFKPLSAGDARARLEFIAREEGVKYDPDVMDVLIRVADGDLRRAITYLQSAAKLHSAAILGREKSDVDGSVTAVLDGTIKSSTILDIAGSIPEARGMLLLDACQSGGSFGSLRSAVTDVICDGYSATQVMHLIHDLIVASEVIDNRQKNAVLQVLSMTDKRLNDGADEELQVLDLLCCIQGIYKT